MMLRMCVVIFTESDTADTALVSRIVQLIYQLQLVEGKTALQHFFHGLSGVVPVWRHRVCPQGFVANSRLFVCLFVCLCSGHR